MLQNKIVQLILEDTLLNYSAFNQDKNELYLEKVCINGDCNESKIYFKSEKSDLNLFIKKFLIFASNNNIVIDYVNAKAHIKLKPTNMVIYSITNENEIEAYFEAFNWVYDLIEMSAE